MVYTSFNLHLVKTDPIKAVPDDGPCCFRRITLSLICTPDTILDLAPAVKPVHKKICDLPDAFAGLLFNYRP